MKKVAKMYNVYGIFGHRQRESFYDSNCYHCGENTVYILNSDITGTNEYSQMIVFGPSLETCDRCANGQISDGIFENSNVGTVEGVDIELISDLHAEIFERMIESMIYSAECRANVADIQEVSRYFARIIEDYRIQRVSIGDVDFVEHSHSAELFGMEIFQFDKHFKTCKMDIFVDFGTKNSYVLNVWHENDIEYVFSLIIAK